MTTNRATMFNVHTCMYVVFTCMHLVMMNGGAVQGQSWVACECHL